MHLQLLLLFRSKQLIQQNYKCSVYECSVADVDFNVGFTHTYLSDVEMEIVSPQGTTVKLFDRSCASTNSNVVAMMIWEEIFVVQTTLQTWPFSALAALMGKIHRGIGL
jgi:subtilisin-like proprotein convertase family protein